MKTKEWYTIPDKVDWGEGPWLSEPDKRQWEDPETGLPCMIKRHPRFGNLCGYVGVPEGHPWYRKDWDAVDVSVHGGLTYAAHCEEGPEEIAICHVPEPGEPDNVWWLGFDCAHAWDLMPGLEASYKGVGIPSPHGGTYRHLGYVEAECARLAKQIRQEVTDG